MSVHPLSRYCFAVLVASDPLSHVLLFAMIFALPNCARFPDDEILLRLSHYLLANHSVPWTNKDLAALTGIEPSEYDRTVVIITTEKITNWLVNCR